MIASTRLLPRRRRQAAWVLALFGAPTQAAAMVSFRSDLHLSSVLLLFLLQAVAAAAVGGAGPALVAAALGFFLANWYFTPPLHTLSIAEQESFTALFVYLVVAGVVSWLVTAVAHRSAEVARARAEAESLARVDELRAALLAAVSHDLRTPLASIKACVTSLLADDVDWPPEAITEFCRTIDEESDRLTTLVGNLLDMSRLQAGVLSLHRCPVGVDEIVPAALSSLGDRARGDVVEVGVAETLPRVEADPALLERVLANLIDNALAWSPPGVPVRVEAGGGSGAVEVRVVDRGPGIPPSERDRVFLPFQRLGDRSTGAGVGLGLAVARGFTVAMGGRLTVEETPGGGTTMVVSLPASSGPDHSPDERLVPA
jgi:two-component system, OmpR family, sensor histidine kinase KdpD